MTLLLHTNSSEGEARGRILLRGKCASSQTRTKRMASALERDGCVMYAILLRLTENGPEHFSFKVDSGDQKKLSTPVTRQYL